MIQKPVGNHDEDKAVVAQQLQALYLEMQNRKPQDRSEEARYWAICITDLEKVIAVFQQFIVG